MTPDYWQLVKTIAGDAWDLPPDARAAFVAKACAADDALLGEVSSLLQSTDDADALYETPAISLFEAADLVAAATRAVPVKIGARVGPYRLIGELGQGGMGTVYLAERADGEFDQQVAIKFVGGRLGSAALLDRFREERQILAVLSHPNIARLLDGGTADDGSPFVVMEYVAGVPISDYCESRRLSIPERLRLFRGVCAAVHYAHQRLVIHRDLKAHNILVTDDGTPKLLDFGIATLIDPGLRAEARVRTRVRALTPESASPEQLRGDPITIATDIYSLGVLLSRLLTGLSPYARSIDAEVDLVRAVCEDPPTPPSVAALLPRGGQTLEHIDRDLDWIVLKALRKEPDRRYSSAEQFSEDLERYLTGQPVLAAPDSRRYRTQKFLRRHRASVIAAALAGVAILTGAGVAAYQAHVARRESALAERRFDEVRSLANSVFDVNDSIAELPGSLPARQLIVNRVAEYLDHLSREAQGHVPLQRELATAYQRLGNVLGGGGVSNLGNLPEAKASYLKALAMRESLVSRADVEVADVDGLAQLDIELSRFLGASGDVERAERSAADAVTLLESPRAAAAHLDSYLGRLATAYQQLGYTQARNNKREEAQTSLKQATVLGTRQVDERPGDPREEARLARIEADYAEQLGRANRPLQAIDMLEDARRRLEHLLVADPLNKRYRQSLVLVWRNEAQSFEAVGERRQALRAGRQSVSVADALRDSDPRDQAGQIVAMLSHYSLGVELLLGGSVKEGADRLRQVIAEATAILAVSPGNNYVANELATARLDLGAALVAHPADAEEGCRELRDGLRTWDELAKRAQVPPESSQARSHYESVLAGCPNHGRGKGP
jgi:serine/threonine protein kinase